MTSVTTNRLTLKRIGSADWKSIQRIWDDQKRSAYACYDQPNDTSSTAVQKRVETWASFASSQEHMFFAVCLEQLVIGFISLNLRNNGYEIGYCFHSKYQGKGYAKESISSLLEQVQSLYPSTIITARTALLNTPSVKLLESLHFQQVGTERISFYQSDDGQDLYFDGGIFERKTF